MLDKSSYSISLGNTHQDGIISSTGMDRYNVKVSADTKLTNNWSSGFTANYITTSIDKAVTSGNGLLRRFTQLLPAMILPVFQVT